MKIVGLISGGKDSIYNMLQCMAAGHEIVAIANIEPAGKEGEMDSYMYQTVGHHALSLVSAAMSLPIYRQRTKGVALCKEKVYVETVGDEVEDLFKLVSKVKGEIHIDGVSVGAIESDYQRTRVENVCLRLGLKCFAYLWKRNQEELLQEMIEAELSAIVVKVATIGLKPEDHLGMNIQDLQPTLLDLHEKFGVHVCGEGGEYETLTLDCPLYQRKIEIVESEKMIHSDDAFAPVGYLIIKNAVLESKRSLDQKSVPSGHARIDSIKNKVRPPLYYIQDCLEEITNEMSVANRMIYSLGSPEVLPFPFELSPKTLLSKSIVSESGSKAELPANSKNNSVDLLGTSKMKKEETKSSPHSSRIVPFSPPSLTKIDTSMSQLNLSTGWCCVGNVTAPNIKEGLNVVRKHLERYQYELKDLVSVTLYVKDMKDWPKMNKTYSQIMPMHCPPTRACVAVPLPHDISVAITAVAHRLVSKAQKIVHYTQHTVDRDYIHVQSISHWAPANIGPYSQSIRIGEIVYVAGQIPLIPGTMELFNGSIMQQCRLALRHIFRILAAVNESYTVTNIMHGICFVTTVRIAAEVLDLWNCLTKNEHAAIAVLVVGSLPKNAELEWLVLACGYRNPKVTTISETVSEDLVINCKRCLFVDHNASSIVCNVNFVKPYTKKEKTVRTLTPDNLLAVMRLCLHILRDDIVGSGTPLCMFNVFYRASDRSIAVAVNDTLKNSLDFKVVVSCVPVVACREPNVFLTITGVCH